MLGGEALKLTYASRPPTVVLLAGLQGSGKTTTAAKLAQWWKQQGRNPMLVGADLQRPAAVEQLRVLGAQIGVTVFSEASDPVRVARAGLEEARRLGRDVCIVDTAGRLAIDEALMREVRDISRAVEPHYTFLVVDAMTGQDAVATATAFHSTLELDGVIVTKLDGDARGGAALSVKEVVGRPIVFASTGEKLADFDLFHPDRMADRILGMGDMLSLIEQAERTMDEEVVARSASRLLSGRFTLEDFLEQLQQVRKLGSLGGIMKLMPGMSKEVRAAADQIDDREVNRVEAIVRSMTPAERIEPATIDGSRRLRIARGSGTTTQDVNQLLKQFKEMQKMMRGAGGPAPPVAWGGSAASSAAGWGPRWPAGPGRGRRGRGRALRAAERGRRAGRRRRRRRSPVQPACPQRPGAAAGRTQEQEEEGRPGHPAQGPLSARGHPGAEMGAPARRSATMVGALHRVLGVTSEPAEPVGGTGPGRHGPRGRRQPRDERTTRGTIRWQ